MSGSNGPDWSLGGPGSTPNCAGVRRDRIALQVPDPHVVATLSVGDLLRLVLLGDDTPTIAVVTESGAEAGAITPDRTLIDCIRNGVIFRVTVVSIDGINVILSIQPA